MDNLARKYGERNFTVINGGRKSLTTKQKVILICKAIYKRYLLPEIKAGKKLCKILFKKLVRKTDVLINIHIRLFTILAVMLLMFGFAMLMGTAVRYDAGNINAIQSIKDMAVSIAFILVGLVVSKYDLLTRRKYK